MLFEPKVFRIRKCKGVVGSIYFTFAMDGHKNMVLCYSSGFICVGIADSASGSPFRGGGSDFLSRTPARRSLATARRSRAYIY